MKLHTKYQRPEPSSFRRRFLKFYLNKYVKQVTPGVGGGGGGIYDPRAII